MAAPRAPGPRDAAKPRSSSSNVASPGSRARGKRPQAAPVTDAEREQIRTLHARGMSCGQIAAELGRNKSTITRQCKALGLSFDRSATEQATGAKVADAKARRAEAVRLLMDDWHKLRERAWSPYTVAVGTGEGLETVELKLPPAQDTRAFYNSMSLCLKDQLAIERHDADEGGLAAVDAWLRGMLGEDG